MHQTDMIIVIYDTRAILPRTPLPPHSRGRTLTLTGALSCVHLCSCCDNEEVQTCLKCEQILARSQVVTPCKLQFEGQSMFLCMTLFFFACRTPVWVAYSTICSPVNSTLSPLFTGCHQNAVSLLCQTVTLALEFDPVKAQEHFNLQGDASLTFYTAN